jgi:hypothetical protein
MQTRYGEKHFRQASAGAGRGLAPVDYTPIALVKETALNWVEENEKEIIKISDKAGVR